MRATNTKRSYIIVDDVYTHSDGKEYPIKRVNFGPEYQYNAEVAKALEEKFAPQMVDPKGNPLGPDGVEGAGIVPWFDNKDGIFPQLPRDIFLVLDVRSPGDKDWYVALQL